MYLCILNKLSDNIFYCLPQEKTREHLLEKIKTLTKVLQEKKFDQPEKKYPSISIDRREAITDLVTFPGKKIFFKRLYAYWKIKRNHRGGAPLLRDPESCYIQSEKYPFSPPPIQRTSGINREIVSKIFLCAIIRKQFVQCLTDLFCYCSNERCRSTNATKT